MRHYQLCLGVFVLLPIVNCNAKNVQLEHIGDSTTMDKSHFNDEKYNGNNVHGNRDTADEIGSGDATLFNIDTETNDDLQLSDNDAEGPDIKITINGSTYNNQATVLVCANRGVHDKITFSPWVHKWGDQIIRDGLHGKIHNNINKLFINKLSLQDMGTYMCLGESGIEGIHAKKPHNASANLKVKGVPIILRENTIFRGKIGQPICISIPFYSDPAVERFYIQTNGTAIPSTVSISTYLLNESIDYLAYGKTVKLEAQALQFIILNSSQSDYKNYTLLLTNSIGHKEFIFQLFLLENTENLSAMMILLFSGLAILVGFYFGLTITVLLIKRRIRRKQGKQTRESSGLWIEMNPVSVNYVNGSEVTSEQEYIRARTTDSNYYAEISDVRVDHRASQDIRPAENFAYDVLHTYGNSEDRSYSSLNPIDGAKNSFGRKLQRDMNMRPL